MTNRQTCIKGKREYWYQNIFTVYDNQCFTLSICFLLVNYGLKWDKLAVEKNYDFAKSYEKRFNQF